MRSLRTLLAGWLLSAALPLQAGSLQADLVRAAPGIDSHVVGLALQAMSCATGGHEQASRLAVIDYSRPSLQRRLWVFDLRQRTLLFHELVAHGRNTGDNQASHFSNEEGSLASSLGLFRTSDTYDGGNGYSLRLDGLDPGFNDHARERAIVMHGAPYVNGEIGRSLGRLGRSWGCPAVRSGIARVMIDDLKQGQFLFSYYPDPDWLARSRLLNCPATHLAARGD
ncbi:MAG: murein L,D-transpeptidase catalytic domain family protein [Perlucidibaca sp.]